MYEFSMITKKKYISQNTYLQNTYYRSENSHQVFTQRWKSESNMHLKCRFFKIQYLKWKKKQKKNTGNKNELLTSSSNAFEKRLVK